MSQLRSPWTCYNDRLLAAVDYIEKVHERIVEFRQTVDCSELDSDPSDQTANWDGERTSWMRDEGK